MRQLACAVRPAFLGLTGILLAACSGAAEAPREPVARTDRPATSPRLDDTIASQVLDAHAEPSAPLAAKEPAAAPKEQAVVDTRPRMAAVLPFAYIYKHPKAEGLPLGYIRFGTSVPLLSPEPVAGDGCSRGWYRVAPRGYACLDRKTTLDL
ncbi:MAG: hypothetical protein IT372_00035, partial [Polyangiaceae bacterium]|nr:hypothetical protein [Polyangiaceae bacterium]